MALFEERDEAPTIEVRVFRHGDRPGDVLEPEPAVRPEDDYPEQREVEDRARSQY